MVTGRVIKLKYKKVEELRKVIHRFEMKSSYAPIKSLFSISATKKINK